MFNQPRKSLSYEIYKILNRRKTLSHSEVTNFQNLKKGHKGEVIFSKAINKFTDPNHHKIFDLNLTVNGSTTQFDALLFTGESLFHFEIKNHSGDFSLKDGNWYHLSSNQQVNNPSHQTSRANGLLKKFLKQHRINLEVKSFTVFVHQSFYLYNATVNRQIIFPGQIKDFLENLNQISAKMYAHTEVYKLLMASHIEKLPHEILPDYTYDELQKGVFCRNCNMKISSVARKYLYCQSCHSKFLLADIIMENIHEFSLLFPDKKITVNKIFLWVNGSISKWAIRSYLKANLNLIKKGKYSFYDFKGSTN